MLSVTRPRLRAASLLAAAFHLAACSDAPTAPSSPVSSATQRASTPPSLPSSLSASVLARLGNPDRPSAPGGASALASVASAAAQAPSVNGMGMACSAGRIALNSPQPQGTPNLVQPFEYAWWYPMLLRWEGGRWALVGTYGWAWTRLPSSDVRWTLHQNGAELPRQAGWFAQVQPGHYYAVVSWVYFEGSRRWVSHVEREWFNISPVAAMPPYGEQWCKA